MADVQLEMLSQFYVTNLLFSTAFCHCLVEVHFYIDYMIFLQNGNVSHSFLIDKYRKLAKFHEDY